MNDCELRVRIECDPVDLIVTVRIRDTDGDRATDPEVKRGTVLRDVLLDTGISPYTRLTRQVNCGGHGLCATCGARVYSGEPTPDRWYDDLVARPGYPRFSRQSRAGGPLTVELAGKVVWDGWE